MSELHHQSDLWDKAMESCPTMYCGRLDMQTWNAANGNRQKMVYFDGEDTRVVCEGNRADFVAYAANCYQSLVAEVQRLRLACEELTRQKDDRQLRLNAAGAELAEAREAAMTLLRNGMYHRHAAEYRNRWPWLED